MFHEALQPNGTLVMEHTQKLPNTLRALFQQVAPYAQVYRKGATGVCGASGRKHASSTEQRGAR